MIIDAHTHIDVQVPGIEKSEYISYGTRLNDLDLYLENYKNNGVDACIVFLGDGWSIDGNMPALNEGLAKLRDKALGRLYPWGCVNPNWPQKKLRSEMRRIINDLGMHGFKLIPLCQGFSIASPGMDVFAEEAIDLNVPVLFHDGSTEYCSAVQIAYYARKYPELTVVSGHGGLREMWPDYIKAVKELPNLWICLSGPTQWGIQTLYDELGPERLLFGSDGGIGHASITTAYLRRIEGMNAPEEHKKMILGLNAARLLKINT